jgi:hypothetical protein
MAFFDNNELGSAKKELLNELDAIEKHYNNNSFYLIKKDIIDGINQGNQALTMLKMASDSPGGLDEVLHGIIYQVIGNKLESGEYHVYRGALNQTGKDFLNIFDKSLDILFKIKAKGFTEEYLKSDKIQIRENIKQIG